VEELTVRDAVHAASALSPSIDAILSADRHFDSIPGVERIDPADDAGVRRLTC
jgi:predicted nucleic acid-binding protein